jgi:hypothetical protein
LDAASQGPRAGITGEVQEVSTGNRSITLDHETQGVITVAMTDDTQVRKVDGEAGTLEDIQPGARIEVIGQAAGAGPLVALEIIILEGAPE